MTVIITHKDGMAKEPKTKYEKGETIEVNERMDLFIDGTLRHCYVTHIEITNIIKEYVVSENKWYIDYKATHYHNNKRVKTIALSKEDIEDF